FRLIVPFGRKRYYTGIVVSVGVDAPVEFEVKDVLMVLDAQPILRHPQLNFWRWIADYYMSSLGDVYKAAVPAGLKVESETFVEINPDFDPSDLSADLTEREEAIISFLNKKGRSAVDFISKETGLRNVEASVSKLLDKGLVVVSEKMVERYRPRKEKRVRLLFDTTDDAARRRAFEDVKGAPKQEQMLLTLVQLIDTQRRQGETLDVKREVLLERSGCLSTILQLLVKKGLAEVFSHEVNRFACDEVAEVTLPKLSEAQSTALSQIHESFTDHGVTLLHGVTSSGKTEIYMHLIDFVLRQGNQVLMLVPEIALTTQLTRRLQRVFGRRVLIYHSKFSDNERVDIWRRLLNSTEPCVVLGARSALFLPFAHLGLVIVDEEHESSYKQYDPAPRYNARDSAIMLAS
ncbi:MAG: DEAD/DEAH box helicase family protein, partial [Muribaculaceae bacterium]|nr:DEAD/DEAH box helicase family protein [Muribaculaceae bacterium]